MYTHARTFICTYSQKYFIEHTHTHCAYVGLSKIHHDTQCICVRYAHTYVCTCPPKYTITHTRAIYTCIYIVSQKISTPPQNTHISAYTYIHPHTHHTHTLDPPTIQYNTHKHITRASVSPGFIIDMCDITQKKNWFCFVLQVLEEAYYFPVNASYATWFVIFFVFFFVENISETYHSTNWHKKYIISVIKRKYIISVIKKKCNVFVNASYVAWYVWKNKIYLLFFVRNIWKFEILQRPEATISMSKLLAPVGTRTKRYPKKIKNNSSV